MIQKKLFDRTLVLKFNCGITNPINLRFVNELSEHLGSAKEDPEVEGLVITSSNDKFFSIGLNIPQLYELPRRDFKVFYHAFNRLCVELYSLPLPVLAAITGHAIAGGCILALFCDYRFIADGRKLMGLNEAKLGVPVPYPADCILREIVGDQNAGRIMDSGDFFEPHQLLQMGMVDRVIPLDAVLRESMEHAVSLGTEAFVSSKKKRIEPVKSSIFADLEEREERFVEQWYSDEARALLREAMEKF